MAPVPFNSLAVGDLFHYGGGIYVKTVPVKKSCCKILYNCHLQGNKEINAKLQPRQPVERYVPEE